MGDFDALFAPAEPKKKKRGDFDALFGEPEKPAKQFPWETEQAAPSRQFTQADTSTVQGPNGPMLGPLPGAPLPPHSIGGNLKLYGQNVAAGARALGHVAMNPSTLGDPSVRHELERGLSDTITFGLAEKGAQKVGELVGDPSFSPEQSAADAQAAPGARAGGALAGSFAPSPARILAGRVGAAIPGKGVLPGAVRGLAQYEATAPLAAAVQAEPGNRMAAATDAATDPTGIILSSGTGAIGGAIARAPERVQERGKEAISRGEAGGTANARIARKANAMAGEGGGDLYDQIGKDLPLEAAQSILAKGSPGTVAKMYTRRLDDLTKRTEPLYKAIDDAPDPRFANPKNAPKNGGIDLGLVQDKLEGSRERALAQGRGYVAEAYDKALARLRANYGTDGKIIPGEKLPSRSMRNYANELGEGLMPASDDPQTRTLAQTAKRQIYRDVVSAIEDEGDRVGVDTTELRRLNRKIATFASTRDALADRATRAAQGHTTLGNALTGSALIGGGFAAGGVEGAVAGAAAEAGRRLAMPAGRAADFALAKLVQASRAGAKPAQLARTAIELGISREVADRIARGGLGVLKEEPPSEQDYTQP